MPRRLWAGLLAAALVRAGRHYTLPTDGANHSFDVDEAALREKLGHSSCTITSGLTLLRVRALARAQMPMLKTRWRQAHPSWSERLPLLFRRPRAAHDCAK